ncbi:Hypothetical protein ORPV_239 [Orpheovirus IHUMI-LCC2]|uniref:Uncharacterized protein n=1 Tax=Orpheovirus IHUMI-LCC2 TaxID=2023057 RepID=A0A2I2L3P5_9VIRU|nr:Hypothetical protein ORPV_239 [Orpheovirus IHUMI-LCC2]SNW62143.1 Hypothetical protein ORPV_239 [Orpheovirus IHUMI-LCC2]
MYGLEDYVYPTSRLMLYNDMSDIDELYTIQNINGMEIDNIIREKCSYTTYSISYLLDFKVSEDKPTAYSIELQGISDKGILTNVGHTFVMINYHNLWYILDSYIGVRGYTIKEVNKDDVFNMIYKMMDKFEVGVWKMLTDVIEDGKDTKYIDFRMYSYEYDENRILERYNTIVTKSFIRLNDDIGKSDEYLYLLCTSLDINDATEYLNNLLYLSE